MKAKHAGPGCADASARVTGALNVDIILFSNPRLDLTCLECCGIDRRAVKSTCFVGFVVVILVLVAVVVVVVALL